MSVSLKPLHQQVMVITGASSGIGLATAQAAAARGARLVLASRNEEALSVVAARINAEGGNAIYVTADVGHRDDVHRIAQAAVEHFGGFDTWVNNAGHSIWGKLDEVSDEDHRRLFETNFWGVVYGSLVAAEQLKHTGGALINVGSVASEVALPLQGMYCASKHAVKGFTDSLRMELEADRAPISVTLIKPTSIDTPFPQHARNYMELEPKLPPPVYPPEEVARAILHAAEHPVRDLYVGSSSKLMSSFSRLAPRAFDWIGERSMIRQQQRSERARDPSGTLYHPGRDGRVHGDHPGYVVRSSLYTRAATSPTASSAAAMALGVAAGALIYRYRHPRTH